MKTIGFACKFIGVPGTNTRTCTLAKATPEGLHEICAHNLTALGRMIAACRNMGVGLFRISSDIIPLASHPEVHFPWQETFAGELREIGAAIQEAGLRVSMHPGQYTVLNSPSVDVVERAVLDLRFHADFLDALGVDSGAKIILHVGGVYGERAAALTRFTENFQVLPDNVKQRLVLENDERNYAIDEVYALCTRLGIPAVMDVFHHSLLPAATGTPMDWLLRCRETWKAGDGVQKIHYSEQLPGGKAGMHSRSIDCTRFVDFYESLGDISLAIMLEVKDKNLSAVKCIHCTDRALPPSALSSAWARYKYAVLARSPNVYKRIRAMFAEGGVTPLAFYRACEEALALPVEIPGAVNAAQHVWGYFKKKSEPGEAKRFAALVEKVQAGGSAPDALPRMLLRLAEKYNDAYLLESLYLYGV